VIDDGCFAYEDDSKCFGEAEKVALRFADPMYLDAGQIDKFMRSLGAKASR
jgi:hypothetical protein